MAHLTASIMQCSGSTPGFKMEQNQPAQNLISGIVAFASSFPLALLISLSLSLSLFPWLVLLARLLLLIRVSVYLAPRLVSRLFRR
jgi:hypothetical protein